MTVAARPSNLLTGGTPGSSRGPGRHWFVWAAGLAALAAVAFGAAIRFQVFGARGTLALDAVGLVLAQVIAAASCLVAGMRNSGRLRLPWSLLGASVASAGLGRVIWSGYELVLRAKLPFPSAADAATLLGVALGIAAVLALPSAPSRGSTRIHVLLNSAILGTSLFFIAWMAVLANVYRVSGTSALGLWLAAGYLAAEVMVLAILWQAILRARGSLRNVLVLLGGAFAVLAITTVAVGYLTAVGRFGPDDRILDLGFVAAFLMIALAPLWPGLNARLLVEEGPVKTSTVVLPPAAIATVVLTILALKLTGRPVDSSEVPIVLGSVLMILLTVNQVIVHRDSLHLLAASRRAEDQLWNRTRLLDEVVSHTPAGLARVGLDLRIIDVNPRVCSLLAAETGALIDAPLTHYLPQLDVDEAVAKFRPFDSSRTDTVESQSHVMRADKSTVWVRWSVTAVRNVKRKIDYFLVMFEDIDAKHVAEEAAAANLAGLERLNRLKSEFVSMVSHEFRTALTGIQGFSELIGCTDLELAEIRQYAGDIFNDARRLSRLITDMLDLDRIEAGGMKIRLGPVDLNRVAVEAVERARVTSSKHVIGVRLDPTMPVVSGDQDRLMQVMTNLLSNAVKYSPNGGHVAVTTRAQEATVTVSVKDQGSGIPPEFMDRLFERYERYEATMTRTIVGTGLGLAIARRIIEGCGGRIWAESKVGVGSEFFFSLPRASSA
jgi:two-component system, sensor histidine kinase and response regulator